jgi:tetratricopeptide (TPR) repeat protein
LFEMGALTAHDLVAQVKLQVKDIILSLFSWSEGQYRFDDAPIAGAEIIPLRMSIGNLILEGVRTIDWEVIRKSLPPLKTVIRQAADPVLLFQDADLQPDQRKVLSLLDGTKSMEEICSLSGSGDFSTLQAIYVLLALRMAETGKSGSEDAQKIVPKALREAVADEVQRTGNEKFAHTITREELNAASGRLERQDHYEMLGIGHDATAQEVRKAYLSLAKVYHPDQHFRPEMNDMKELLETLFHGIHEAYDTLTDQGKRDRYDHGLARGETNLRAAKPAHAERSDNRNAAAGQFEEGMKRFNEGNFWGAEESFEWAMRLDPGNANYVFHQGLALSHIPQRGRDAEEYFVRAIDLAPINIQYHLELRRFYVRHGLKTKALSVYKDVLKRVPNSEKIMQAIQKAGG